MKVTKVLCALVLVLSVETLILAQGSTATAIPKLGELFGEFLEMAKRERILMPTISADGKALMCVNDKDEYVYCSEGNVRMKEIKNLKYNFTEK